MSLLKKHKPDTSKFDLVVVGLGNPGRDYHFTRHNIGFRCVDRFAVEHGLEWKDKRGPIVWTEGQVNIDETSRTIMLVKPRTFMNLSGEALKYITTRWRIPENNLLIVYDEMDLSLGTIRVKPRGSSGGHNGIRSIISELGTEEIPRIRIGIGRDFKEDSNAIGHVLSSFDLCEEKILGSVISNVSMAISQVLVKGLEDAMNRWNKNSRETNLQSPIDS